MFAKKGNSMKHVNAVDIQPLIDEGGYEFYDDENNLVEGKALEDAIEKEREAHSCTAGSFAELVEQLKAQGIEIKEE